MNEQPQTPLPGRKPRHVLRDGTPLYLVRVLLPPQQVRELYALAERNGKSVSTLLGEWVHRVYVVSSRGPR